MADPEKKSGFGVQLAIEEDAAEQDIIIAVTPAESLSDQQARELCATVEGFVSAAGHGMFCGNIHSPTDSRALLLSTDKKGDGFRWNCTVKGLCPFAYKALLGLMFYYSFHTATLKTLSFLPTVKPVKNPMKIQHILGEDKILKAVPEPGFRAVREPTDRQDKHRRIQIEFLDKPDQKTAQKIMAALESWEILCFGAFPKKGRAPHESGISPGEIYMVDQYTIEHTIELFEVSETAFNAVINMAEKYHRSGSPVERVVIF